MKRLILHISALFALTSCVQQNRMPDVHILHDTVRDTVYLPMPDSDAKGTDAKAEETQSVVVKEGETSKFDGLTCKEYDATFGKVYDEVTEFRRELRIVYPIEYDDMVILSKIQKKVLDATGLNSDNPDIKSNISNTIESDFKTALTFRTRYTCKALSTSSTERFCATKLTWRLTLAALTDITATIILYST